MEDYISDIAGRVGGISWRYLRIIAMKRAFSSLESVKNVKRTDIILWELNELFFACANVTGPSWKPEKKRR